jgi:hypothetical protein
MNELMSPCTFPCWRRSCEYQDPISMNEFLLLLFLRLELAFIGMQFRSKFAVDTYINLLMLVAENIFKFVSEELGCVEISG